MTPVPDRTVDLEKSTSVRFPRAARRLMSAAGSLAPRWTAARFADRFLTPMRVPTPEREREWLDALGTVERHRVRCGAYDLAVSSAGLGGPQVLLVHGWSGRGSQLGAFIAPLLAAGFEVNWFDLPAHGASSGERSGLIHAVHAVSAMTRWLGGAHTVIAHSMGAAATTLAAAGVGVEAPAEIDRMVYLAPPDDVGSFLWVVGRMVGLPDGVIAGAQEEIQRRYDVRFDDLIPTKVAGRLRQPLLALHDRDDREIHLAEVERLVGAWPAAELVVTEGLGHRRILRDPAVIDRVLEFVTPRPGGRRRAA